MTYPIKICAVCEEEFELKPGKPGFANRCPECSENDADAAPGSSSPPSLGGENSSAVNEARRQAMRQLLYSKEE